MTSHRRRPQSYRPSLELLEIRIQPGSMISSNLDLGLTSEPTNNERRAPRRVKKIDSQKHGRTADADSVPRERKIKAADEARQSRVTAPPRNSTPPPPPTPSLPISGGSSNLNHGHASLGIAAVNNSSTRSPSPASQMDSVGTATVSAVGVDRPTVRPSVIPLSQSGREGYAPDALTNWSSFIGAADVDLLRPIAVGPDGLYTGGFITDPATHGVQEMLIAKVSFDGTTLMNAVALSFPGATFNELTGIDVDSAGNIYGIGVSNFQGFDSRVYFRLESDWQTVTWSIAASVPSWGHAIYHDENSHTVYVTGDTDGRSIGFPQQSLSVARFSGLGNTAGPTKLFSNLYAYDDFDGASGTGIGLGPDMRIEVSGTFSKDGNIYAAQHELSADGETANGIYFDTPGSGGLTSIYVDAGGNAYSAGYIPSGLGDGRGDLLLVKTNPGLSVEYAYSFGANDVDLNAYGIALDAAGNIYVAGNIGLAGDWDALIAKFSPDGTTMTDAVMSGGYADDLALSIAYDPATNSLYTAGYTISTEFETTVDSFQPIFGGLMDGFIMRLSNFT